MGSFRLGPRPNPSNLHTSRTLSCERFKSFPSKSGCELTKQKLQPKSRSCSQGDFILLDTAANGLQVYNENDNGWDQAGAETMLAEIAIQ